MSSELLAADTAPLLKKRWLSNGKRKPATKFNGVTYFNETGHCRLGFTVETTYGVGRIDASMCVQSNIAVNDVGDTLHALMLGVIEPKIQFVEDWLRCTLDVVPDVEKPNSSTKVFTLFDKGGNGSEISLHLPVENWYLIPELAANSIPLEWELSWADHIAHLVVGNIAVGEEEFRKVDSGSVVLIPESFNSPWQATLEFSELSVILPGALDPTAATWSRDGEMRKSPIEKKLPLRAYKSLLYPLEKSELFRGKIYYTTLVSSASIAQIENSIELSADNILSNVRFNISFDGQKTYTGNIGSLAKGYALFIESEVSCK